MVLYREIEPRPAKGLSRAEERKDGGGLRHDRCPENQDTASKHKKNNDDRAPF